MQSHPIAIIGAGMAGLSCGLRLTELGQTVRLFDKGRAAGGRMATRRATTASGPAQFDHGAQFFTARDATFAAMTARLIATGAAMAWPAAGSACSVGAPGMSAVCKALAAGLDIGVQRRALAPQPDGEGWAIPFEDGGREGPFDAVIIATPAEQAVELLAPAPLFAAQAAAARTAPCWALMCAFPHGASDDLPEATRLATGPIAWLAVDSAKPGRPAGLACLVAHASAAWSCAHLEWAPEQAAAALLAALAAHAPGLPDPVLLQAHRWRYAMVEQPAATPFAWDADARIGACGDWRIGPRVESAFVSGRLMAEAIAS
jgi:hypothetical protein